MKETRKNLGKVSLTAEGSWSMDKSFRILSIVYDEHTQHGFISRCDVPAGVDLYNKEYWMPLNVSGYADNNMIILSKRTSESAIESYTLEEAVKSIASVGRRPGTILGFYNENSDRMDIGGCWELWQYNGVDVADWENLNSWNSIYYNYNKFVGWYRNEDILKKYVPFPEVGCYAYVGSDLNDAVIYRCDRKYAWTNTNEHAWNYIKLMIDGNVTIGENGNWFNNGIDTGIPASVKGENGKTPIIRNNNNILEYSYDNINWNKISDEIAAWFRWQNTGDKIISGKIQITRDGVTWTDLSGEIVSNLHISRYIGADESLPVSGIAEGTIYAKGPYYEDTDTNHDYPAYRIWVYAWKGNTLAWVDHGQFTSIAAGIVQETGDSEVTVMSQKAVTEKLSELGRIEVREVIKEIYAPKVSWSSIGYIQLNLGYYTGGKYYNALYLRLADGSNTLTVFDIAYSSLEEALSAIKVGIYKYGNYYVYFGKEITKSITATIYDYYDISDISLSPTIYNVINKNLLKDLNAKEYIREIYVPNAAWDMVDHIDVNLLYKAGSKYYNAMYLRDAEGNLVSAVFERGFETIEDARNDIAENNIIANKGQYVLFTGKIPESQQTLVIYNIADIRDIDNSPILKNSVFPTGLSDDSAFNHFVNELFTDKIALSEITKITLNVAKKIGNLYYNSLYLRKSEGTLVIFDENFETLEEALASFEGIKGGVNGYALVVNSQKMSTQLNYVVTFNHPLSLEYAPSIRLHLNPSGGNLIGKKVVWEGDSIMADNTYNSTGWRKRIERQYGMTGVNYSRGGSTFTANIDGLDIAYNMALRVDSIVDANPNIDYFILDGGTNDADRLGRIVQYTDGQKHYERQSSLIASFGSWSDFDFTGNYDKNTFCGAVEYVFWKLKTSYTNVKIGMIIAPKMGLAQSLTYVNRWEYFAEIIKLCKKWGIPYIDLWNNSLMNPNIPNQYNPELDVQGNVDAGSWYLDGQHPAPLGYDYSSKLIAEWMEKL